MVQKQRRSIRDHMAKRYNARHNVKIFKIGDIVTFHIPKDDRTPTDNLRICCRILEIPHENRFKLLIEFGVLTNLYPTSQLNWVVNELSFELINKFDKALTKEITLHTAAAKNSTSDRVSISCNCSKDQCMKRCRCVRNNVKCSIYCHDEDRDCGNLGPLVSRTEITLIDRSAIQTSV